MTNPLSTPGVRDSEAYLAGLGERVRLLRSQRGMTRKALSQHAKVSERYLAQLEAGKGNGSIVLLRRVARAIGTSVAELVREGAEPPIELTLLTQYLERLSPEMLVEVRKLVTERFRSPAEHDRARRIALIGLRGGGKSTLGPLLAEALEDVLAKHPQFVMATSGSIVTEAATLERLLSSCFTVWLRAEPAEHMQRVMSQGDMRPMAHSPRAMADLLSILDSRKPLYAKADIAISTTDKTPDQALAELLHAVTVPDNRISRRSA
jgi:XRE family aerobic/anaerobic benzoate catabolism transcriptional regulator